MTADLERIAREAGLLLHRDEWHTPLMDGAHSEELARFAALIAADCASILTANAEAAGPGMLRDVLMANAEAVRLRFQS